MAYDDYCHVEKEALYAAVRQALETAGKVDIIFPAGSMVEASPTNYLSRLGELRVSTHTYYDNLDAIKNIKYEYELFGVHLNTLKIREGMPSQVCYLPHEMFNQKELWGDKKGLWIYTSTQDSLAVAKALVEYGQENR